MSAREGQFKVKADGEGEGNGKPPCPGRLRSSTLSKSDSLGTPEVIVEYEPDPDPRDTEQISFLEAPPAGLPGGLPSAASAKEGIEAFIRREGRRLGLARRQP